MTFRQRLSPNDRPSFVLVWSYGMVLGHVDLASSQVCNTAQPKRYEMQLTNEES